MVQALRLSHISAKSPHNSGGFPCPQMALSFLSCHAAGEAQASSRTVAHEAFTRQLFFVEKTWSSSGRNPKHIFKNGREVMIESRVPAAITLEMTQIPGENRVAIIDRAKGRAKTALPCSDQPIHTNSRRAVFLVLLQCGNSGLYGRLRQLVDEAAAVDAGRGVAICWNMIVQSTPLRHDCLEAPADHNIL